MLPQLAATGEDTEAADDAAWVVEATVADAEEGTTVELVAKTGDGWETVDEAETDKKGEVALTSRASGDLHVVVRELTHRIAEVSEQVRDRMNRLGDADLVSQDVLIEVVRKLEEQQWMLRAQLGENV